MRRICPECGSTSVVTFDADEDWCTQCKSRFPGEATVVQTRVTAAPEIEALRSDEKPESSLAWKAAEEIAGLRAEVERLTTQAEHADRRVYRYGEAAKWLEDERDRYKEALETLMVRSCCRPCEACFKIMTEAVRG